MNIAIAGDSFAAKHPQVTHGWPDLLKKNHTVVNVAQAGISEYKILNQVKTLNLSRFDCIIVSHTGFSRVHTPNHPIHKSGFHKNCDLILSDLTFRRSLFNDSLNTARKWFKHHYDDQYQRDIYNLIREEINRIISIPYISIDNLPINDQCKLENNHLDFTSFWPSHRGNINHYTKYGNIKVAEEIENLLTNIT